LNEKNKSIAELWDGQDLKCTFRRNVSEDLYQVWLEVVALVSTINLTDDEDEMVWLFNSSIVYSSQSLYKIINFRGIKLYMYLPFGTSKYFPEYIFSYGN
jgi:hypothetical protein